MSEASLGENPIPHRREGTPVSPTFAEALRPAIAKLEGEVPVDWSAYAQPASVVVTLRKLTSLSKDELPAAISSIRTTFAPPSEGDVDPRSDAEKEVYGFVDRLLTRPTQQIKSRLIGIRSIYDQSKDH